MKMLICSVGPKWLNLKILFWSQGRIKTVNFNLLGQGPNEIYNNVGSGPNIFVFDFLDGFLVSLQFYFSSTSFHCFSCTVRASFSLSRLLVSHFFCFLFSGFGRNLVALSKNQNFVFSSSKFVEIRGLLFIFRYSKE